MATNRIQGHLWRRTTGGGELATQWVDTLNTVETSVEQHGSVKEQRTRLGWKTMRLNFFCCMPRVQPHGVLKARKLNLVVRSKYELAEYFSREASMSSDFDTSGGRAGGCKRGKVGDPLPKAIVSVQNAHNAHQSCCPSSIHHQPQSVPWLADDSLLERPWNCTKVCTL